MEEVVDAMNSEDLLDYSLGLLDGQARELVEREAAGNPVLAKRIDRLGQAVHQLLDDGEPAEPPAGLAWRTVAFVAQNRHRRRGLRDFVPVVVPFRLADVAVAAGIFLAGLLTLIPAAHRGRLQKDQLGCVFNLQQLGLGLGQYANTNHVYPYAPPECPAAHAGAFAFMLHDAGLLPDRAALDCPCNGRCPEPSPLPDFPTVCEIQKKTPDRYVRMVGWDYAYHVGYHQSTGKLGPMVAVFSAYLPILADRPPHDGRSRILDGNSPNHRRRGQNVLYTDGHVLWHNTRRLSPRDPDMFLNAEHRPAPGVSQEDAALVPGPFRFDGRVSPVAGPPQP